MASTQVLSYLSTPAYYVTYNAANRLYQENCSGVRSVFSMWTRSSARLLMQKFVTANAFQQLLVLLLLPEAGGRVDDFDEWLESKKHRRCSLQTSFRHVRGHFLRWTFIFAFSPTDVNNVSGFGKLQPRWRYPQTHVFISVRGINDERKLEYLSLRSDWIDVILFNVIFRNDGKERQKKPLTTFYWQVIQEVSVKRQFLPRWLYFLLTKHPTRVSDLLPVYNTTHMPSIRELAGVCCMDVSKNKCGLTRWIRSLSTSQGAGQRSSETPQGALGALDLR